MNLTLEDLKKLPQVTVTATIQCAGQRRNDLKAIKPGMLAIQTRPYVLQFAVWTGISALLVTQLGPDVG